MRINIYDGGEKICSFDDTLIGDILRADTSPAQRSEAESVTRTLMSFSDTDGEITVDLKKMLSEEGLSAEKTLALPVVFSVLGNLGCEELLSESTSEELIRQSDMYTAAMEIKYKNLAALARLGRTVISAAEDFSGDLCSADEAAEVIAAALPAKKMRLTNPEDISFLSGILEMMRSIAESCSCPETGDELYGFIDRMSDVISDNN